MGIWITICIQKPSHHFLQTFRPLRMFKIVFRESSLYSKQLCLLCLLWLSSANFAKTLFWKAWIWRQIMTSQTTHTKYNDTIRHWMKPPWKFSAYATACSHLFWLTKRIVHTHFAATHWCHLSGMINQVGILFAFNIFFFIKVKQWYNLGVKFWF